jgi:hypothetical protein
VLKLAQYDALGRLAHVEIGQARAVRRCDRDYTFHSQNARLTRIVDTPGILLANDGDGDRVTSGDTCLYAYDPTNTDTGGVGRELPTASATPASAATSTAAAASEQRRLRDRGLPLRRTLAKPELCDVNGSGACDLAATTRSRRRSLSPGTAELPACAGRERAVEPARRPLTTFDGLAG